ncbi:hypothetical protein AAF712_001789 [Marasmius tenuissimus]|uniref:Uncharacterized protein n=1 Tax=Marasmius tenuissimus TaxID=585030 RepID=A0ABR3ADY2_9AGAR
MERRSLLSKEEPTEALCNHLNVYNVPTSSIATPPPFISVPSRRDPSLPTHILALYPSSTSHSNQPTPLLVPVNVNLYNRGFRTDVIPPATPGTVPPVPHSTTSPPGFMITLPVIPLTVPHPPSIPLLLLYGMGLETEQQLLPPRLLPEHVIAEFPNAAEMAQAFATRVRDSHEHDQPLDDDNIFQHRVRFNQGLWQNVLALGLKDQAVVELIQTAWNITAEARRLRLRYKQIAPAW